MNLLRTTARVIKRGRVTELPNDNTPADNPRNWNAAGHPHSVEGVPDDQDDIDRFVRAAVGMNLSGREPVEADLAENAGQVPQVHESDRHSLQQLRDAAQAEGYAAGWELAQQEAAVEVDRLARERAVELARGEFGQILDSARHLVAQLERQQAELLTRWETDLTVLAAQLAERILQQELARRPAQSASLVREALTLAAGLPVASLRLHPADLELLTTPGSPRLAGPGCELIADEQLQRGGCVVELAGGEIDARIETRLTRLVEELTGE